MNFQKTLLAGLLGLAATATFATDYYVVVPMPGKTNAAAEAPSAPAPTITLTLNGYPLPSALVGRAYAGFDFNTVLQVAGDAAFDAQAVSWEVVSGALPAGLTLGVDGRLSGTPSAVGSAAFQVKATYKTAAGTQAFEILAGEVSVALAAATLPAAVQGAAYSHDFNPQLMVSGDPAFTPSQVLWVLDGALPAGLTLNANGTITGVPTAEGSYPFTVRAQYLNKEGAQSYQVLVGEIVVSLAGALLPAGVVGEPYAGVDFTSLVSVSGDAAYSSGEGLSWRVVSGALPSGLALEAGELRGIPLAPAAGDLVVEATYKNKSAQRSYALNIAAAQIDGTLTAAQGAGFGTVVVGNTVSRTFGFTNTGNTTATGVYAQVTGAGLALAQPNTCGTAAAPVALAKGASCEFTVSYTPTSGGALSGSAALQWAGPYSDMRAMALTGLATVDYSHLMTGFTRDTVQLVPNVNWAAGVDWYWTISTAASLAPAGDFEFRRVVTVSETTPVQAYLSLAIDNQVKSISLNGNVISGDQGWTYQTVARFGPVTLQPGINVLSMVIRNAPSAVGDGSNPAGMSVEVQRADGSVIAPASGWKF